MRYLLMITEDESAYATMSEEDSRAMYAEYEAFNKNMADRGILEGGERLRLTSDATTVRVRNGEILTTDGPFAETKEQLGGYYLIDVPDLDAALSWAARCPAARYGTVEVRPIWIM